MVKAEALQTRLCSSALAETELPFRDHSSAQGAGTTWLASMTSNSTMTSYTDGKTEPIFSQGRTIRTLPPVDLATHRCRQRREHLFFATCFLIVFAVIYIGVRNVSSVNMQFTFSLLTCWCVENIGFRSLAQVSITDDFQCPEASIPYREGDLNFKFDLPYENSEGFYFWSE
jgi:hypothetical protein